MPARWRVQESAAHALSEVHELTLRIHELTLRMLNKIVHVCSIYYLKGPLNLLYIFISIFSSNNLDDKKFSALFQDCSEFIFMPPGGELRPLESTEVKVMFTPQAERSVRTVFDLIVDDGNERCVYN